RGRPEKVVRSRRSGLVVSPELKSRTKQAHLSDASGMTWRRAERSSISSASGETARRIKPLAGRWPAIQFPSGMGGTAFFGVLAMESTRGKGSRDCLTLGDPLQRKVCRMVAKIVTL